MGNYADRARDAIEEQGGTDALSEEDERFWGITREEDSLSDRTRELIDELQELDDEELGLSGTGEDDKDDEEEEPEHSEFGHYSRSEDF